MYTIKQFINGEGKFGHMFEVLIQFLILGSLVILTLETLPSISVSQKIFLENIDTIIVIAILPVLLFFGFDLQFVRILRFLRIFRLIKLARYNKALNRVQRAFSIAKEELLIFVTTITSLLYFSAIGIYQFEHEAQPEQFGTIFDSFWWAIVTLTTVGYGDVVPITLGGRLFTMAFLLLGVGMIAAPTGLMASAVSRAHVEEESRELSKTES